MWLETSEPDCTLKMKVFISDYDITSDILLVTQKSCYGQSNCVYVTYRGKFLLDTYSCFCRTADVAIFPQPIFYSYIA
jgi:hypothetical protein